MSGRRENLTILVLLLLSFSLVFTVTGNTAENDWREAQSSYGPRDAQAITYVMPYDFGFVTNPFFIDSYGDEVITSAMFASLARRSLDNPEQLIPDLAQSWSSVDGETYRVVLRPYLRFSDGVSLTSADVVVSLMAAFDLLPFTAWTLDPASVVAINEQVIEFRVVERNFLGLTSILAEVPIVPVHVLGEDYFVWPQELSISSGMYKLSISQPSNYVQLTANFHYWDRLRTWRSNIRTINFETVYDQNSAIRKINYEQSIIVDPQYALGARANEIRGKSAIYTTAQHQEIALNNLHPLLDENCERAAISELIDRQQIIDAIYSNRLDTAFPAASVYLPYMPGYDPNIFDVEIPTCPNAGQLTFITPNTNPDRLTWANIIVDTLNQAGYDVTLISAGWEFIIPRTFGHPNAGDGDPTTTIPLYDDGGYDALFVGYSWGLATDLALFTEDDIANFYNYVNPEYDILHQTWLESEGTELEELGAQMQLLLTQTSPSVALFFFNEVGFYDYNIRNVAFDNEGFIDWYSLQLQRSGGGGGIFP